MTTALHRLGAFCARRHRLVLLAWLLVVGGLAVWAGQLGTRADDNITLPGTGSQRAADILNDDFGGTVADGTNPIVLRARDGAPLTAAGPRAALDTLTKDYAHDPAVRAVVSPLTPAGAAQLSPDRTIGYLSLSLRDGPSELTVDEAQAIFAVAQRVADRAGLHVAAGGYLGSELSQAGSGSSEGIGLLAAVVVLLLTFGTVVAMGLPILTALFGLGSGLSLLTLASHVVEVPSTAPALATMIGLGVGIDYALFVVTRHRQQLAAGVELRASVARAVATSGGAVVFAGSTVVIALCSLLLTGIPIVQQMGVLSAIAVLAAMLAAITLLPAALAAVGTRIDALALPWAHRAVGGAAAARHPGGWLRWARLVADRPWPALVAGLLIVGALAWPITTLALGQSDNGQLPRSTTARQSYDLLAAGFGPGSNGPLLVAVTPRGAGPTAGTPAEANRGAARGAGAPTKGSQANAALAAHLGAALRATPGVAAVSPPLPAPRGEAILFTVTPTTAPSAPATERLVHRLRDHTIPAALAGSGASAAVGGATAAFIDLASEISGRLPLVIGLVLVLSFLLLMVAFRSLVVPLKAVVMNLLSIGAAFGIVSYVFGHHWSVTALGIDGVTPIVSFVPLMMFAILFGLSMDYEVFLMTHVRERWEETGDAHRAVVEGLAGTARVITSAALIMVAVFSAFLLNGNPTIKQFGLGMAAAVAVDATVIRCLVVPAVLSLLGRRAWWLPRWLERVMPRFSIEGEHGLAAGDSGAERREHEPTATL